MLIVDDAEDNRDMYAMYARFAGFRADTAVDGTEAIAKALSLHPDVIVLDLSMPGMDGWTAARRLKLDARTRDIPVIALTAHALEGAERGALAAGCDAYLAKPCLPDRLLAEVRRHLEHEHGDEGADPS